MVKKETLALLREYKAHNAIVKTGIDRLAIYFREQDMDKDYIALAIISNMLMNVGDKLESILAGFDGKAIDK
jgi:glutamate/tyrosine decarboxylase-like PLP-dependent enzyme